MTSAPRPAFYALAPGGWRDYVTLLHPPYTLWHLCYVAIGAALVPALEWPRLACALAAFFLGLGVGAHALDELRGRPLATRIPERMLIALAAGSLAAGAAIGVAAALAWNLWLLAFVAAAVVLAVAYNLELFGGRLHSDNWFAFAWGAFPLLTAYFGAAETLTLTAGIAAAGAFALSRVQRHLSTIVRTIRRGQAPHEVIDADALVAGPERALKGITYGLVVLAVVLVSLRLA